MAVNCGFLKIAMVTDHQKYINCIVHWYGFQHLGIPRDMCSGSNITELFLFLFLLLLLLLSSSYSLLF